MSEIAAWKIPDIDNVSDGAIDKAWKDWAVIEMGKRCVLVQFARGTPETRDVRALCLAFLHDCSHCIYFAAKVSMLVSVFLDFG
jgi:hypothetical protein